MGPGGGADEHELEEELGALDGGEDADHGGDGVADEEAAGDAEGVEDGEEVVDVGVEGGVAAEVEVVGVDAAGADEVVGDDAEVVQVRKDAGPGGLIGAEAMGEDHRAVAGADHAHVQDLEELASARATHHGGGGGRRRPGTLRPRRRSTHGVDWLSQLPN